VYIINKQICSLTSAIIPRSKSGNKTDLGKQQCPKSVLHFKKKEMSAQEKRTSKKKRHKFVTNNPYKKLK
jgi:hypothetical protein